MLEFRRSIRGLTPRGYMLPRLSPLVAGALNIDTEVEHRLLVELPVGWHALKALRKGVVKQSSTSFAG